MQAVNRDAVILVATDVVADAALVRKLLSDEFDNVILSTDPDRAVADFEQHRPDVLILAFNSLGKAERYYLGLYRLSRQVHALPHRTLILSNKDDMKRVYELCRKEYFDDYVLFWPVPHDALRLPMTVHHALRQIERDNAPSAGEIATQARRLAELEALLERHAENSSRYVDTAGRSLQQAQSGILAAIDDFYAGLAGGRHAALVDIKDHSGFQREVSHLRKEKIEKHLHAVDAAVQPMRQWAGRFKQELAPQLESARVLQALAGRVSPTVMVVDDDEFQHKLLAQMLDGANYELVCAATGAEALGMLRHRRPDLILMDINLPGNDGVDITRRIKAVDRFAAIPVIMITGHSEKDVVMESLKAGAIDFVVKPLERNVLVAKLQKLLNGGAATQRP